jgi:hypothetical protein
MAAATAPIVGSWKVTLNPTSTTSPAVAAVPGLITYTSDGLVLETDGWEVASRPGPAATSPVLYGTPGHGAWNPGPTQTNYAAAVVSLSVNANGTLHSTNVYQIIVTVDTATDQLTGSFELSETAPSGQVTTISGSVAGQRILAPALP